MWSKQYVIAETETFVKRVSGSEYKKLYRKIKDYVYPQLQNNLFYGPHIKKLKGKHKEYYRYRIARYRLFYKISQHKLIIFIISIEFRKNAYN